MMEYILRLLRKHELQELAVTQYLPERIKEYFDSGEAYDVSLNYFLEKSLGTGRQQNAASMLNETFLVISGDCLTDIDLTAAVRFHRQKQASDHRAYSR